MFEVLPKVVAVPFGGVHRMGRFGNEEPVVWTVKREAVNDAPWDDDVVPRFEGHLTQHGVERSRSFVHEDHFIAVSVFEKFRFAHARRRRCEVNGHVGVEQHRGPAIEVVGHGFHTEPFEFPAQQVVFDGSFGLDIA